MPIACIAIDAYRCLGGALMAWALVLAPAWSTPAETPCDALVRAALPMARQLLASQGEFTPFGLAVDAAGEVAPLDASTAAAAGSAPTANGALRDALALAVREGRARAAALVYEATLSMQAAGPPAEAVAIQLLSRGGATEMVVVPYRFDNGQPRFGEPTRIAPRHGACLGSRRAR
jgi:hypothetical protein